MSCPLDYSLCCQTVTIYHREKEGVSRRVVKNAFLQWQDAQQTDTVGRRTEQRFLLILPGDVVVPGDRVMEGEGPIADDWNLLVPGKVPGLGEVNYAQKCYWQGKLCHTEAGRRWNHAGT